MSANDETIEIALTDEEEKSLRQLDAAIKAARRPAAAEASEFVLPQAQTVLAQILANHGIAPAVIPELEKFGFQMVNGVPSWREEDGRMRLFYRPPRKN